MDQMESTASRGITVRPGQPMPRHRGDRSARSVPFPVAYEYSVRRDFAVRRPSRGLELHLAQASMHRATKVSECGSSVPNRSGRRRSRSSSGKWSRLRSATIRPTPPETDTLVPQHPPTRSSTSAPGKVPGSERAGDPDSQDPQRDREERERVAQENDLGGWQIATRQTDEHQRRGRQQRATRHEQDSAGVVRGTSAYPVDRAVNEAYRLEFATAPEKASSCNT